ncbi:hypothetical protein [Acinetobacter sp. CFCC 10889]|uniref:hypothetical protein n=1 Tax=Acinetobacter sp. CFCC 10889 TaxID=1775557 RepID=UPI000DD092E0|nr:hypothetical protein [Acinetobacter sp. CFCC 10889]
MSLNEYHTDIRRLINKNKKRHGYGGFLFAYQIGRDEIYDPSLISQRVYQTRSHGDVVRIASGVSFAHEPLPQNIIILPKLAQIIALQRKYGVTHAF